MRIKKVGQEKTKNIKAAKRIDTGGSKRPLSCLLPRSQGASQRQRLITDTSGFEFASFESVPRRLQPLTCVKSTTSGSEAGLPAPC